jgi:hypothetical protein
LQAQSGDGKVRRCACRKVNSPLNAFQGQYHVRSSFKATTNPRKHINQRVIGPEDPLNSRLNTLNASWPLASDKGGKALKRTAGLCQPSTLRIVIWPEASRAQNSIAAVLIVIFVLSVAALFLAHEDPFARNVACAHTGFCPVLSNAKAWNKIFYDLAVGTLITCSSIYSSSGCRTTSGGSALRGVSKNTTRLFGKTASRSCCRLRMASKFHGFVRLIPKASSPNEWRRSRPKAA